MAKFCGVIGYAEITEVEESEVGTGVWLDTITEYTYYGDIVKNVSRLERGEGLNDNVNINNNISIVSDPFANQNIHKMRYVQYNGILWKITNIDVQYPRLILTIGGVYNGPTPIPPPTP